MVGEGLKIVKFLFILDLGDVMAVISLYIGGGGGFSLFCVHALRARLGK